MDGKERIEELATRLGKYHSLDVKLEGPSRTGNVWFLRLNYNGLHYVIEYRKEESYGLSLINDSTVGDAADEYFEYGDEEALVKRIVSLIKPAACC